MGTAENSCARRAAPIESESAGGHGMRDRGPLKRRWLVRSVLMRCRLAYMSLAAGGSLLVLEGCDPNARETVLSGVEAATTGLFSTFIAAFF